MEYSSIPREANSEEIYTVNIPQHPGSADIQVDAAFHVFTVNLPASSPPRSVTP